MPPIYKDHYPLQSPGYKGLYIRDISEGIPTEEIPSDHLFTATNVWCRGNEIQTRPPLMGQNYSMPGGKTLVRARVYENAGVTRYLVLFSDRTLYNSADFTTIIVTAPAGTTDFSSVTIFGRAYITFHNGINPLVTDVVRVYDGSTIRDAGGAIPATALVAANGAAGKVEAGLHKIAYINETDTGYYSSHSASIDYTAPGAVQIDLTSIDVGPAGTVNRHIIATKVMLANEEPEWFFVPGGEVTGNVATTKTVNFYDSELVDSADYLLDILATIPAGLGIGLYKDRMIVWGESANVHIVRVSEPGEPEVFNEIDGFITTNPHEGGVRNCFEQRTQLYICKASRTDVTNDNGQAAATWDLHEVDSALGADTNSIGGVYEATETTAYDLTFIANKAGLWLFNGRFADTPLSWKIQGIWTDSYISATMHTRFHQLQVLIDVHKELIYILIPFGDTSYNLLVCNYEDGLDPEAVKWQFWEYNGILPYTIFGIVGSVFLGCNDSVLSDLVTDIYKINYAGVDTILGQDKDGASHTYNYSQVIQFPFISFEDAYETHFNAIKLLLHGYGGTLDIHVYRELTGIGVSPISLGSLTVPNYTTRQKLAEFNHIAEKASFRLTTNGLTGFRLLKAISYVNEYSFDIPASLK